MIYIKDGNYIITNRELEGHTQLDENSELGQIYLTNYPYVEVVEKEGIVTDVKLLEKPTPTPVNPKNPFEILQEENTLLKAQVNALATNQEFLENCLIEVGQVIYA